jgi:hypothetical protein
MVVTYGTLYLKFRLLIFYAFLTCASIFLSLDYQNAVYSHQFTITDKIPTFSLNASSKTFVTFGY